MNYSSALHVINDKMTKNNNFNIGVLGAILSSAFLLIYSFSISVAFVIVLIFVGIGIESASVEQQHRKYCNKLLLITFAVYAISAIIFSTTFEGPRAFVTPDALQYFSHLKMTSMDLNPLYSIIACYGLMDDGNEMHELFVRYCILFSNNYLDGASVIYLTMINVLFGVMSIGPVYRILLKVTTSEKAYKYTLAFALLSPFHFYSVCFVRDIIITFFYAHAIELTFDKFKIRNLLLLLLIVVIVWGIRLYSGLFVLAFVCYYIFVALSRTKMGKKGTIFLSIVLVSLVVPLVFSTDLYNQSSDEIESYYDYNHERASTSSLSVKLEKLPPVVREVSLVFFSQIAPFPPHIGTLDSAESISQVYVSIVMILFEIYWYFVFFGLIYMLILYKGIKYLSLYEIIFFSIVLLFLYLNTSQVDTRRLMCVYPYICYLYVKLKSNYIAKYSINKMIPTLSAMYVLLYMAYFVIK